MIQKLRNGTGAVARFGNGTIKVRAYTLKTEFGGQVELTSCRKTSVGSEHVQVLPYSNKIVLDFKSVESIDVLLDFLNSLRHDLANETNSEKGA